MKLMSFRAVLWTGLAFGALLLMGVGGGYWVGVDRRPIAPAVPVKPDVVPAPLPAPVHPVTPVTPVTPTPLPLSTDTARAVITTINGQSLPASWPLGFSIGLSAENSVCGAGPNSVRWDIEPAAYEQFTYRINNNRHILVPTGTKPVILTIRLTVTKGDTIDVKSWSVPCIVDPNGPAPAPSPAPNPPFPTPGPIDPVPTPTPVVPTPAPANLDVLAIATMLKTNIDLSAARKAEAVAIAANYDAVRADISKAQAGVPEYAALKTPNGIVLRLATLNRTAVGTDRPAWVPFFGALKTWSDAKVAAGSLVTSADYIAWCQSIGDGLRAGAL
jgi:hypothetical protein